MAIFEDTYNATAILFCPDIKGHVSIDFHNNTRQDIAESIIAVIKKLGATNYEFVKWENTTVKSASLELMKDQIFGKKIEIPEDLKKRCKDGRI